MKYLKSENKSSNVLLWSKKGSNTWVGDKNLDDPNYDPQNDVYLFHTSRNSPNNRILLSIFNNFSHSIEFIEFPPYSGNSIKVRIAPIINNMTIPIFPDFTLISHDPLLSGEKIDVRINSNPIPPQNVFILNKYDSYITLIGLLNGSYLNKTVNPNLQEDLGPLRIDKSIEFIIQFSNRFDAAKPCKIEISIDDLEPKLVCFSTGSTELMLCRSEAPGNINITIEPDMP